MSPASGIIVSFAYILGLLSTATTWGGYVVLGLGIGLGLIMPRFWRTGPQLRLWLVAGIVGLLASVYFQARLPRPAPNDISNFVPTSEGSRQEQIFVVQGEVESEPRVTRSGRSQFWLAARQLGQVQGTTEAPADVSQGVRGRLYVTMPLLQTTGLHSGEAISVTGVLYKPKHATNPGAFDFKAYLAREGGFAGFSGRQISWVDEQKKSQWGWWAIRQRIIRSQVNWLGSPEGPLLSSIVLGGKAVDLPYDIRDQFIQVGLAHALAASGFQVSLILGVLLALTRRFSAKVQFIAGTIALIIFVGLTGVQPSVMRAAVMGFGVLVALIMQRKTKPIGLLLVAASLLLLLNPLWIWDLGFQLSFLATLGLLVTVSALMKRLDWLPPAIASLVAVPVAAALWTLPLQLYVFGLVPSYSIAVNIISTPLIALISIGGVISALLSVFWSWGGSSAAWLLYHPTHWLIGLVQFFCWLPGSSVAIGKISVLQLLAIYGLMVLVWLSRWLHKRWWLALIVAIALVVLPIWETQATLFRATVLATDGQPVLVIQDQGKVALVNSGDTETANFTVLPFLQQQGVNQIDWAVAIDLEPKLRSGWLKLLKRLPVKSFYDVSGNETVNQASSVIGGAVKGGQGAYQALPVGTNTPLGSTMIKLLNAVPPIIKLQIRDQVWLVLPDLTPEEQKQVAISEGLPRRPQVLWWSGGKLTADLIKAMEPGVAIASSFTVDPEALSNLQKTNTKLYWTGRDGAIQWTPADQFEPTLEVTDSNTSFF